MDCEGDAREETTETARQRKIDYGTYRHSTRPLQSPQGENCSHALRTSHIGRAESKVSIVDCSGVGRAGRDLGVHPPTRGLPPDEYYDPPHP